MRTLTALSVVGLLLAAPASALADTEVSSAKLFAPQSVRVRSDAATDKFLASVAQHLSQDPDRRLRVVIHCDERAGAIDNTALAAYRVKDLLKALKKAGVKKKQVVGESVGHSGVEHTPETSRIVFDFADDAYIAWPGDK